MKIEETQLIRESIQNSYAVLRDALAGNVTAMRYALCDLGKRCSEKWIYAQTYDSTDVRRMNFLATYKLWKASFILSGNRMGAELINNDIEMFDRLCWSVGSGTQKQRIEPDKRVSNLITRILCDTRTLKEMMLV